MQQQFVFPSDSACQSTITPAVEELLKEHLGVRVAGKGREAMLIGPKGSVECAAAFLDKLQNFGGLGREDTEMMLLNAKSGQTATYPVLLKNAFGKGVRPKTERQHSYVEALQKNKLTFGTGPAGTGKTYLASAVACSMLNKKQVQRIIVTRPVVEAGEKLGFLPGELENKLDPYLRPLYDAFEEFLGVERTSMLLEDKTIEIAPLAYMRGRTFRNAFILFDEAQNASKTQMELFLTRIGTESVVAVNGDTRQLDITNSQTGLEQAVSICQGIPGTGSVEFTRHDCQRSPLVAAITGRYERLHTS